MKKNTTGADAPPVLRIPLLLIALADLALLAMRLRPWSEVMNLPLNGATGIDPGVALLGYMGLIFWTGGSRGVELRKGLFSGALLGLLGGVLLVGQVAFNAAPHRMSAVHVQYVSMALMLGAVTAWGASALHASMLTRDATMGMVCGAWSAMASCLLAFGAILTVMFLSPLAPQTTDPWKLYEGLAIGNAATQALVQSLNRGLTYLLLGPLLGGILGLLVGFLGQNEK